MNAACSLLVAMIGLGCNAAALAGGALTLYFEERAPYQVRSGAGVEGLTASPAAQAFKAAGVAFVWEASSITRQLHMLRENQGGSCVVGLFKTSERLAFAKYTKPIYRDGPIVALVRRDAAVTSGRTLYETLSAPGLRLLVRGKYSYGSYVDSVLKRINPATVVSPLPNFQMTELIVGKRADLMFASEEEAVALLQRAPDKAGNLQLLRFSDALPGVERHIACTFSVPDDVIDRLNRAIAFK